MPMTEGLDTPLGEHGSGRRRYGAAMALHNRGLISDAVLEVYRICSALDGQDPNTVLASLQLPMIASPCATQTDTLRRMMAEVDLYLARTSGTGVAEVRASLAKAQAQAGPAAAPMRQDLMAQALTALAQTHPALAAAIGNATPFLDWQNRPDGTMMAQILAKPAPPECDRWDLALMLLPPQAVCPTQPEGQGMLVLPLTGPYKSSLPPAQTPISKPAHRPIWIDAARPVAILAGEAPLLALIARPISTRTPNLMRPR